MRTEGIAVGIATAIVIVSSYGMRGTKWEEEEKPVIQPRPITFGISWGVIFVLAIAYAMIANNTTDSLARPTALSAYLFAAALTTCAAWPVVRRSPRRALVVIATASVFAWAAMLTEQSKLTIYGAATQCLGSWLTVALLLSSILAGLKQLDTPNVLVSLVTLLSVLAVGVRAPFFTLPLALACISQTNFSAKEGFGTLTACVGAIVALMTYT